MVAASGNGVVTFKVVASVLATIIITVFGGLSACLQTTVSRHEIDISENKAEISEIRVRTEMMAEEFRRIYQDNQASHGRILDSIDELRKAKP